MLICWFGSRSRSTNINFKGSLIAYNESNVVYSLFLYLNINLCVTLHRCICVCMCVLLRMILLRWLGWILVSHVRVFIVTLPSVHWIFSLLCNGLAVGWFWMWLITFCCDHVLLKFNFTYFMQIHDREIITSVVIWRNETLMFFWAHNIH